MKDAVQDLYSNWKSGGHEIGEIDGDGILHCAHCEEVMTFPVSKCPRQPSRDRDTAC